MPFKRARVLRDGRGGDLLQVTRYCFNALKRARVLRGEAEGFKPPSRPQFQCPVSGQGCCGVINFSTRSSTLGVVSMPFKRARVLRGPPSEVLDCQGVAKGVSLTSVIGGFWRVSKGIFFGWFFEFFRLRRGGTNPTCLEDISRGGGPSQALNSESSSNLWFFGAKERVGVQLGEAGQSMAGSLLRRIPIRCGVGRFPDRATFALFAVLGPARHVGSRSARAASPQRSCALVRSRSILASRSAAPWSKSWRAPALRRRAGSWLRRRVRARSIDRAERAGRPVGCRSGRSASSIAGYFT